MSAKPGVKASYVDWVIVLVIAIGGWMLVLGAIVGAYYLVRWTS